MNIPGASFRARSLHSRIARLASTEKRCVALLQNAGVVDSSHASSSGPQEQQETTGNKKKKKKSGFKQIENYLMKKRTVQQLTTGMIVKGTLVHRDALGITVRVSSVFATDNSKEATFEDLSPELDILAVCLYGELELRQQQQQHTKKPKKKKKKPDVDVGDDDEESLLAQKKAYAAKFKIGSIVKACIIKVDRHTLEIYVSTLSSFSSRRHPLGLFPAAAYTSPQISPKAFTTPAATPKCSALLQPRISPPFAVATPLHYAAIYRPSMTRVSSSNGNSTSKLRFSATSATSASVSGSTDHDNPYYANPYYVPSQAAVKTPLDAAMELQENMKRTDFRNQNNLNEFDLLQNKFDVEDEESGSKSKTRDDGDCHQPDEDGDEDDEDEDEDIDLDHRQPQQPQQQHSHRPRKLWIDRIRTHELFRNPSGLDMMRDAFGVDDYASLMWQTPNRCTNWLPTPNTCGDHNRIEFDKYYLRDEQAYLSSRQALETGVFYAKKQQYEMAMSYYDVAIAWDARYADAMVAKSAALCHLQRLDDAESCIHNAIEIAPNVRNGQNYLSIILQKKREKGMHPAQSPHGRNRTRTSEHRHHANQESSPSMARSRNTAAVSADRRIEEKSKPKKKTGTKEKELMKKRIRKLEHKERATQEERAETHTRPSEHGLKKKHDARENAKRGRSYLESEEKNESETDERSSRNKSKHKHRKHHKTDKRRSISRSRSRHKHRI